MWYKFWTFKNPIFSSISIQECVDYSLPLLTLCFLPQNTSISSFPLLFPIQFCESLWVSGLRTTLWEQITTQLSLSPLESPFFSSCSCLSPSSLPLFFMELCEPLWVSLTVENPFTINLEVLLSVLYSWRSLETTGRIKLKSRGKRLKPKTWEHQKTPDYMEH